MKLAIIIPAYNEEKVIKNVLLSLPKKIQQIKEISTVVIDDGSTDNTYEIAKENSNYSIRHIVNLGVGAATTTGFEVAKKIKTDIVVTIDADGQHCTKDVKKLIKPILDNNADVVIGTRMKDTKGMPGHKIFGNWFMNIITLLIFRKWTTDSQSGMRAYNKKALKKICLHSIGYEICSETIGEIKRNKLRMVEVPIETIYTRHSIKNGQLWLNGINIFTKIIAIKLTSKK